ncbi:Cys-tRNA(Pro) deacylase [Solicola gregarius]|uniref:Cys-tRNA(Pro)/Cys-tRNA(Cys) deacylase n=1 Tax=Solicola gregarius TaxID=2908642 RepID=A0AA46YK52_9ACTN|nr:Cys-tRNA(Pro) deacylase [Solicola gregarius]UYM05340.1 Cys-tRNA(Pro) deacylase [Solicola gregarius]
MARRNKAQGSTPATTALARLDISFVTHAYDHDPAAESYGREAAEALGVDAERIFKTLLATLDGSLVVGIVPVLRSLDLKSLARAAGGRKAAMADPAGAERATGYVVGGISPIGQRRRLRTLLDESAAQHAAILVSGGRRGFDIELAPDDLLAATSGMLASIAR